MTVTGILRRATALRACASAPQDKIEVDGGKYSKQKLILGTHTSDGDQNHLVLAEVTLPTSESEADASGYDEEAGEVGGYGAAAGRVQVLYLLLADQTIWKHY